MGCCCSSNYTTEAEHQKLLNQLELSKEELQINSTELLIPGYIRTVSQKEHFSIDIDAFYHGLLINIFALYLEPTYRLGVITKRKQEIYLDVIDLINIVQNDEEKEKTYTVSIDTIIKILSNVQSDAEKKRMNKMKISKGSDSLQHPLKIQFSKLNSEELIKLIKTHGIDATVDPYNLTERDELAELAFNLLSPPPPKNEDKITDEYLCILGLNICKKDMKDAIFHACVDTDWCTEKKAGIGGVTVPFTPLDAEEFILLKFVSANYNSLLLFQVNIDENYDDIARIWSINVNVQQQMFLDRQFKDIHVIVSVPTTENKDEVTTSTGSVRDGDGVIHWFIPKMKRNADNNHIFSLEMSINGLNADSYSLWRDSKNIRKCVKLEFEFPGASTNIKVRYLKVKDTQVTKWVRYLTFAGDYVFEF